jgi:MFS family permease
VSAPSPTPPSPAPPAHGISGLLRLELATLLSGIGNGVALVALPWLILERTGSATAAGVVGAAAGLPMFVSSIFSGTLVDVVGRRRMAVISDVCSAAAVAAIPLIDELGGLTLGVLVALAMLGAVFDPAGFTARETMLPAAAARAGWTLDRVNGVHEAVWGAAFLIGPGVGGVMIAVAGAVGTLWITAAGFAASAVLLATLRLPGAGRPVGRERPAGIWRGTREGLVFLWNEPVLRAMGILTTLVLALYLPIEAVVLPVYFEREDAPERLGLLVMAMGAGGVAGALAYGALGARVSRRGAFVCALALSGLALVGLALLPPFGVMLVLALAFGLFYGPVGPLLNYAMQTRTPERLRGRVVGTLTSVGFAAGSLGFLVIGPLVQFAGLQPTFLALAGCVLAVTLASLLVASLHALDRPPVGVA